jgi:hypothetical protein
MTFRRRKTLHVSVPIFLALFRTGRQPDYEVVDGMPKDAAVIDVKKGSAFGTYRDDTICLVIESETFPELAEGDPIPEMFVTFRRIEPGSKGSADGV